MSIHPDKTRFIIFKPKHENDLPKYLPLFMNLNDSGETDITKLKLLKSVPNSEESSIRILGYLIDQNLTLNEHFSHLKGKLTSANYSLKIASSLLDQNHLKMLYHAQFHSVLTYSAPIISMLNTTQLKQLQVIQRKAIRIIFKKGPRENVDNIFKINDILPVDELIIQCILKFMFQYSRNTLSPCFRNFWTINRNNRDRNLRNDIDLYIPTPKYIYLKSHPIFRYPVIWNRLSFEIRNAENLRKFLTKSKSKLQELKLFLFKA